MKGVCNVMYENSRHVKSYLGKGDITSHVQADFGGMLDAIHTEYHLTDYTVFEVSDKEMAAVLDIHGSYNMVFTEDFLQDTGFTATRLEELSHDDVILNGIPYSIGVNQPGRLYTQDHEKVANIAENMYEENYVKKSFHMKYTDDEHLFILTHSSAVLYTKLVALGLPENIALKITVNLSEYHDAADHLDTFLEHNTAFPYDSSIYLTLFEVYVFLAELLTADITQSIVEVYNHSMDRTSRLWRMLRRGGEAVFQRDIRKDMMGLDPRAASILLTMLDRGLLSQYNTGSAVVQLLHNVEWDAMLVSVEKYVDRMIHNGIAEKLHENFHIVSSRVASLAYAESFQSFQTESITQYDTLAVEGERRRVFLNSTIVKVDLPLLANIQEDDDMLFQSIDAVLNPDGQEPSFRYRKKDISVLYMHLYWSSQGLGDMPMDWLVSTLSE